MAQTVMSLLSACSPVFSSNHKNSTLQKDAVQAERKDDGYFLLHANNNFTTNKSTNIQVLFMFVNLTNPGRFPSQFSGRFAC